MVDGNEQYLLDLAMTICRLDKAGYDLTDIGDYVARTEHIPNIKSFDIAMEADLDVFTQLQPRLVP